MLTRLCQRLANVLNEENEVRYYIEIIKVYYTTD